MRRIVSETLPELKARLRAGELGGKAKDTGHGQVQCPFCAKVYKADPRNKEHSISGICDDCFPSEPTPVMVEEYDDDEDKPF